MTGAGRATVRLIATDLDGTLLRSDGSVSDRTRASLLAAREAGIEVVPATGRPHRWSGEIIARLDFLDHWVFANGSVTWNQGRSELVRGTWLAREVAVELTERLRRELPGVGLAVEQHGSGQFESRFVAGLGWDIPGVEVVDDVLPHFGHTIQKLLVADAAVPVAEDLYDLVTAIIGADAFVTFSGLGFVEVAADLVCKSSALAELSADLGIGPAEVVAFGDNHNDVGMLRWAGCSYAMGHAAADVRQVADLIIGSNDDDAVAATIDRLVAEQALIR